MKILLDECLPRHLRKHLVGHHCETAPKAGFAGRGNGQLLAMAEQSGWQVPLTMDRGMPSQQNLAGRTISIIIVQSKSNRLPDLLPLVPAILKALDSIQEAQVVQVG